MSHHGIWKSKLCFSVRDLFILFYLRKTPAVAATTTSTKKVVLNRKPISVAPIPAVKDEVVPVTEESKASSNPEKVEEKKVVKLGTLSTEERAKLRAEKFGVPISDSVKKMVRAQRFGLASKPENTDSKEVPMICLIGLFRITSL